MKLWMKIRNHDLFPCCSNIWLVTSLKVAFEIQSKAFCVLSVFTTAGAEESGSLGIKAREPVLWDCSRVIFFHLWDSWRGGYPVSSGALKAQLIRGLPNIWQLWRRFTFREDAVTAKRQTETVQSIGWGGGKLMWSQNSISETSLTSCLSSCGSFLLLIPLLQLPPLLLTLPWLFI